MAGCDEGDHDVQEDGELGACSVDDPEDVKTYGDFGKTDPDYVEYLRDGAPFQRLM